jgi:hypothetical protein
LGPPLAPSWSPRLPPCLRPTAQLPALHACQGSQGSVAAGCASPCSGDNQDRDQGHIRHSEFRVECLGLATRF